MISTNNTEDSERVKHSYREGKMNSMINKQLLWSSRQDTLHDVKHKPTNGGVP